MDNYLLVKIKEKYPDLNDKIILDIINIINESRNTRRASP